jgi:nucleoside diphosphate kinase
MERTYIMVKPDGVERGIVGEIIKRFEQRGYQLTALELIHPTRELLEEHVSFFFILKSLYRILTCFVIVL